MRRKTTTLQLNTAIKNKLLHITKTEIYNKSTRQTDVISPETFRESLDFICESIFADCIGWHYEFDIKTGQCIIEAGRMDGDSAFIIIVHLCVNDGVSREEIDKILNVIEEELFI